MRSKSAYLFSDHDQGIEFYIKPNTKKLLDFQVWIDAAGQILFSLSAGNATMPTLASFNRFHKVWE